MDFSAGNKENIDPDTDMPTEPMSDTFMAIRDDKNELNQLQEIFDNNRSQYEALGSVERDILNDSYMETQGNLVNQIQTLYDDITRQIQRFRGTTLQPPEFDYEGYSRQIESDRNILANPNRPLNDDEDEIGGSLIPSRGRTKLNQKIEGGRLRGMKFHKGFVNKVIKPVGEVVSAVGIPVAKAVASVVAPGAIPAITAFDAVKKGIEATQSPRGGGFDINNSPLRYLQTPIMP